MTLNYLLRVSFVFTSKISEDRHVNFHYKRECWFTPAKTGLYSNHEPNNKGFDAIDFLLFFVSTRCRSFL
jgi:hypothetical protein